MDRLDRKLGRDKTPGASPKNTRPDPHPFWTQPESELLTSLGSSPSGLSSETATERQRATASNALATHARHTDLQLLLSQFANPIILIMIAAAIISFFLSDPTDASIILIIVIASGLLGFWQERAASHEVETLLARVAVDSEIIRDGTTISIPASQIVPGDIVTLNAGDIIPGDGRVLQADALQLDEAPLTGEPFPVLKTPGVLHADTPIPQRANVVYMGSSVVSGRGSVVIARTGIDTQFGAVSTALQKKRKKTGFAQGIGQFGYFLARIMFVLLGAVFIVNILLHRPFFDSLLFSLALAIGITPQLLPAIVAISLATGARAMAREQVIVKRLDAIEDFGAMSILFTDKTGTLTEGTITLSQSLDPAGAPSDRVERLAWFNAHFQTGYKNPLDAAILHAIELDPGPCELLGEAPYDFARKRLSVLICDGPTIELVTKGALTAVLDVCVTARLDGKIIPLAQIRPDIDRQLHDLSSAGFRLVGVATKVMPNADCCTLEDEHDLIFEGMLVFTDPPKQDAAQAIVQLDQLGVSVRMLTGDHALSAAHTATAVGLITPRIITGSELAQIPDDQLFQQIQAVTVFAEMVPDQKERVINTFRTQGEVVGYLGDGINDAPSIHSADVGISVDTAVDVARQAAAIVLLDQDLGVVADGVRLGRKTFANTMKYINVNTSASFGNVLSMAIASIALPFLPMLPTQILLLNFMADIPDTTIASDRVDPDMVLTPQHWDFGYIKRFMIVFGPLSSAFDLLTFLVLRKMFHAPAELFHGGWFLLSLFTQLAVLFILRTRRPFYRSRPGSALLITSIAMGIIGIVLPWTPFAPGLGLVPLGARILFAITGIAILYIFTNEIAKHIFYARHRP